MNAGFDHNREVCEFAAQRLATQRNGGDIIVDSHPDEVERQRPAVDLIAHDLFDPIAAEHTVIEAYEDQIHDNRRISEVFANFHERFRPSLPGPGTYTLAVHTRGGHQFPRRGQDELLDGLEGWVRAQMLPEPAIPPTAPNHVSARQPEVPVAVTLYRMLSQSADDGSLRPVVLLRSGDHEAARVERIDRALRAKLEKLEASRPPGGTTLLILESRDCIMSNPVDIARAVGRAATRAPVQPPDAIIHVDTTAGPGSWIDYYVKLVDWWCPAGNVADDSFRR